jgi:hypothetical protein
MLFEHIKNSGSEFIILIYKFQLKIIIDIFSVDLT